MIPLDQPIRLNQTPPAWLTDGAGRPYFLWDSEMTLAGFLAQLRDDDPHIRGHYTGKLMRQAKEDDVFLFVKPDGIARDWDYLVPNLGWKRPFWTWIMNQWGYPVDGTWPRSPR